MVDSLPIIKGLYPEDPETVRAALEEYKKVLKDVQDVVNKREAEEAYIKKIGLTEYSQMTLADLYPEVADELGLPERKGRVKDLLNN